MSLATFRPSEPSHITTTYSDDEGKAFLSFLWVRWETAIPLHMRNDFGVMVVRITNAELDRVLENVLANASRDIDQTVYSTVDVDELRRRRGGWLELAQCYMTISNSPPKGKRLSELARKATSPIVIGTAIGSSAAASEPLFAFITIPSGIIVVGAAAGIAEGLREGLATKMKAWLK